MAAKKATKSVPPKTQPRLTRSSTDRILGGVCGGIAEYLKIESIWIRLIAVVFLFVGGLVIPAYIIAWILIPIDKKPLPPQTPSDYGTRILGVIFIVVGALLFLRIMFEWVQWIYIWPIVIILIGIMLLARGHQQ